MPPKHGQEDARTSGRAVRRGYGRTSSPRGFAWSASIVKNASDVQVGRKRGAALHGLAVKTRYAWRRRSAAARAVVDEGMASPRPWPPSASRRGPRSTLVPAYREGGADSLSGPSPRAGEGNLRLKARQDARARARGARVRRLEAENRLLKKVRAWRRRRVSSWEKSQVIEMPFRARPRSFRPVGSRRLPRSTYYRARSQPCRGRRGGAMGEGGGGVLPHGHTAATQAGRHALRAEEDVAIADKTALKIMHEMGISCGIRRESDLPQVQLVSRRRLSAGRSTTSWTGLLSRRTLAEARHGRHRVQGPVGRAYFAPSVRLRQQGDRVLGISRSANMAQQKEMLEGLLPKMPEAASPVMHSDMGWQYQHDGYCKTLEEAGIVQSMSRKGNCIDNAPTEQVFGHNQGRVLPRAELTRASRSQGEARAYIVHWNTRRRQVKLKGLTRRNSGTSSLSSIATFISLSKEPGAVHCKPPHHRHEKHAPRAEACFSGDDGVPCAGSFK